MYAIRSYYESAIIEDELADDYGEVLGEGFHGLDDDYYFDEEDLYFV